MDQNWDVSMATDDEEEVLNLLIDRDESDTLSQIQSDPSELESRSADSPDVVTELETVSRRSPPRSNAGTQLYSNTRE